MSALRRLVEHLWRMQIDAPIERSKPPKKIEIERGGGVCFVYQVLFEEGGGAGVGVGLCGFSPLSQVVASVFRKFFPRSPGFACV